ncbi:MAG: hypothetical protein RSB38_07655 [Oscillospiraceae bacterium]
MSNIEKASDKNLEQVRDSFNNANSFSNVFLQNAMNTLSQEDKKEIAKEIAIKKIELDDRISHDMITHKNNERELELVKRAATLDTLQQNTKGCTTSRSEIKTPSGKLTIETKAGGGCMLPIICMILFITASIVFL